MGCKRIHCYKIENAIKTVQRIIYLYEPRKCFLHTLCVSDAGQGPMYNLGPLKCWVRIPEGVRISACLCILFPCIGGGLAHEVITKSNGSRILNRRRPEI
jgi:hypothetical protein